MPDPDRIIASRPQVREALLAAFLEAVRSGTRGVEYELRLHARPWDFRPEDIPVEVMLWHGNEDANVPFSDAELLAAAIPNCRLTVCPGAGHLLIDTRFEEIVAAMSH